MKNVKRLLVAAAALLSASSMANLVQPIAATEEGSVHVFGGIKDGMKFNKGFGVTNLGVGLGFSHNVGYDFSYGASIYGDYRDHNGLWTKDAEKANNAKMGATGIGMDVELMARYMPEVADSLFAGIGVSLGWGTQFTGDGLKDMKNATSFGDMNFKVGIPLSYQFSEAVSAYVAPTYMMTAIRWVNKDAAGVGADQAKDKNHMGMEVPVGASFCINDGMGFWIEANSRMMQFKEFSNNFKEEVTLGVTFAL